MSNNIIRGTNWYDRLNSSVKSNNQYIAYKADKARKSFKERGGEILNTLSETYKDTKEDVKDFTRNIKEGITNRFSTKENVNTQTGPDKTKQKDQNVKTFDRSKTLRTFYEIISLYEFTANAGLAIVALTGLNTYALSLLVMTLVVKQIPERLFKDVIFSKVKDLREYNERPFDAENCNMFNKGGSAAPSYVRNAVSGKWEVVINNPGFPSGHTTIGWFLAIVQCFEAAKGRRNTGLLIFTLVMAFLIAVARVQLKCHTFPQVMGGMIMGVLLALLFVGVENSALIRIPRYVEDKNKFYALFSV